MVLVRYTVLVWGGLSPLHKGFNVLAPHVAELFIQLYYVLMNVKHIFHDYFALYLKLCVSQFIHILSTLNFVLKTPKTFLPWQSLSPFNVVPSMTLRHPLSQS